MEKNFYDYLEEAKNLINEDAAEDQFFDQIEDEFLNQGGDKIGLEIKRIRNGSAVFSIPGIKKQWKINLTKEGNVKPRSHAGGERSEYAKRMAPEGAYKWQYQLDRNKENTPEYGTLNKAMELIIASAKKELAKK
jgi:hypothetical protein